MARLTVLGLGNILMQDEGVGVRVMEAVRDGRRWPADIEFIDGGAGGMNLLNLIEQSASLVVFDAADMQLPPGQHRVITPEQVQREDLAGRVSLHRVPFLETLELCRQFLASPREVRILAIQPELIDYGRQLSATLTDAMPDLAAAGTALVESSLKECS